MLMYNSILGVAAIFDASDGKLNFTKDGFKWKSKDLDASLVSRSSASLTLKGKPKKCNK